MSTRLTIRPWWAIVFLLCLTGALGPVVTAPSSAAKKGGGVEPPTFQRPEPPRPPRPKIICHRICALWGPNPICLGLREPYRTQCIRTHKPVCQRWRPCTIPGAQ